jgi:transcriptional regulator with XRE-family HTH domain
MDIGDQLREFRRSYGWTQNDVATQIGVRQKTVSDWESGKSISAKNSNDIGKLIASAQPPLGPLNNIGRLILPLNQLSEQEFEQFCADLLRASAEFSEVNRLGEEGQKQEGLDGFAQYKGERIGWQAKCVQKFSKSLLAGETKKLKSNPLNPKSVLLILATRASTDLRKNEALVDNPWTIKDDEDVSGMVRALAIEDASRLLRRYWPSTTVSEFLGSDSNWFRRPSDISLKENFLNHAGPTVGRESFVQSLLSEDDEFVIVEGRVGEGKTRLGFAIEEAAKDLKPVKIVLQLDNPNIQNLSALDRFTEDHILIVDDLDERPDVPLLCEFAARTKAKIIAFSKPNPENSTTLVALLAKRGVNTKVLPLPVLEHNFKEEIVRQLAPNIDPLVTAQLLGDFDDSLLALVIAAKLRNNGSSSGEDRVWNQVRQILSIPLIEFAKMQDDRAAAGLALAVIVATQPLFPQSVPLISEALGIPRFKLDRMLSNGKARGLIEKQNGGDLVVPAITCAGYLATAIENDLRGLVELILQTKTDPACVIRNVSSSLWCLPKKSHEPILLKLGTALFPRATGNLDGTARALRTMMPIAELIPEYARSICEDAVELIPADNPGSIEQPLARSASLMAVAVRQEWSDALPQQTSLRDELSKVLGRIAIVPKYCNWAISRLLILANLDDRPPNQYPRHPIRQLEKIANLSERFPSEVRHSLIVEVAKVIDDSRRNNAVWNYSPFELLQGLFARDVELSVTKQQGISIARRSVVPERSESLRKAVKTLCDTVLTNDETSPILKAEAYRLLASDLNLPHCHRPCPHEPSCDEKWEEVVLATLDSLESATSRETNGALKFLVRDLIHWHVRYGSGPARERALLLWQKLDADSEVQLFSALIPGRGVETCVPYLSGDTSQYDAERESEHARISKTVKSLLEKGGIAVNSLAVAVRQLHEISDLPHSEFVQHRPRPIQFIDEAVRQSPVFFTQLLEEVESFGERSLAAGLARLRNDESYEALVANLWDTRPSLVVASFAHGELSEIELDYIGKAIGSSNPQVICELNESARNCFRSLGAKLWPIVELFNPLLHGEAIQALESQVGYADFPMEGISERTAMRFLEQMRLSTSSDSHGKFSALARLAQVHSKACLSELINFSKDWSEAITLSTRNRNENSLNLYKSILTGGNPEGDQQVIAEVRTKLLEGTGDHYLLASLYRGLVGADQSPRARSEVLWVVEHAPESQHLWQHLDSKLFLKDSELVSDVLARARTLDPGDALDVFDSMLHCALNINGFFFLGDLGHPHLLFLSQRASELADQCNQGSESRRFFEELAQKAAQENVGFIERRPKW